MKRAERMVRWANAIFAVLLTLWFGAGMIALVWTAKTAPMPGFVP